MRYQGYRRIAEDNVVFLRSLIPTALPSKRAGAREPITLLEGKGIWASLRPEARRRERACPGSQIERAPPRLGELKMQVPVAHGAADVMIPPYSFFVPCQAARD